MSHAAGVLQEASHQVDSQQEMTEEVVSYDIPYDLADPDTSGNIAYGDHLGITTKQNPSYGQAQM